MGGMKPLGEEHLALFRRHMVEIVDMHVDLASEELGKDALEPRLRTALLRVQRHLFVPAQLALAAYQDTPLPIGFDKTVSQPFIGALMLDLLDIGEGESVLEVGTGLGYQAAVMAEMGAQVWSVEVVEEFAAEATMRLRAFGYGDVQIRTGDGSRGWNEHAPFDKILVTAAAPSPPQTLVDQLRPGGRLVMPLGGKDVQQLSVVEKRLDGSLAAREVMPVRFTQLETVL
jgi:protein-L-isoaspartate(D-aspartate) O-methyltransferase